MKYEASQDIANFQGPEGVQIWGQSLSLKILRKLTLEL